MLSRNHWIYHIFILVMVTNTSEYFPVICTERLIALCDQRLWSFITFITTSNRSNNTNPKVDLIPVSCRWPAQLSPFFPSSLSAPFSLSSQAPRVVAALSWNRAFAGWRQRAAARTCHITLSSTVGQGQGTWIHAVREGKSVWVRLVQTLGKKLKQPGTCRHFFFLLSRVDRS